MYLLYATCVELDIPILVNVGVPGPRLPMAPQHIDLVDEVCWFFPELKFVMRHGAEPWQDMAVKLMLKYPNLYYSTSAFAPKYYPREIIEFANSRGAEHIALGRVARQNSHSFAKHFMARGNSSAKVVVVESRQIIMDKRIGVHHFYGRPEMKEQIVIACYAHSGRICQDRPDAFPSCEN